MHKYDMCYFCNKDMAPDQGHHRPLGTFPSQHIDMCCVCLLQNYQEACECRRERHTMTRYHAIYTHDETDYPGTVTFDHLGAGFFVPDDFPKAQIGVTVHSVTILGEVDIAAEQRQRDGSLAAKVCGY